MRHQHTRVAIVIPAYNEGGAIAGVLKDLRDTLKTADFSWEIIVVDDGSQDDTAQIASQNGACVIGHILNTGSGGATATGLSYAQQNGFNIVATLDADGQHLASDVLRGIQKMLHDGPDLLIGSRLLNTRNMSFTKSIGNKFLSTVTFLLFGINITDTQSGLRIFSQNALRTLRWKTNGYEFCSEMLWRAKQQGMSIDEYPVETIYTKYSTSKGQSNWNGVNIVRSLIQRRVVEFFSE